MVNQILYAFFKAMSMLASVLSTVLVLHAILSWFVSPFNKFQLFLGRITGPLCAPFRPLLDRLIKRRLPIDLAPLAALLALSLAERLCMRLAYMMLYL